MALPPLEVLHCESHLLVVCKPAGVPTVPDASGDTSLLEMAREWVKARFHKPGRVFLGVVHRLDRPVSGVLLLARTSKAAARLSTQFRGAGASKLYLGRFEDVPREMPGRVEQWLLKDARENRVRAVDPQAPGARLARTRLGWLRAPAPGNPGWVALWPETGRPHQLRAAMAGLGAPLLGDVKYGAPRPLPDASVALHALRIEVGHPTRDERLRFECPLPARPWWSGPVPGIPPAT